MPCIDTNSNFDIKMIKEIIDIKTIYIFNIILGMINRLYVVMVPLCQVILIVILKGSHAYHPKITIQLVILKGPFNLS